MYYDVTYSLTSLYFPYKAHFKPQISSNGLSPSANTCPEGRQYH